MALDRVYKLSVTQFSFVYTGSQLSLQHERDVKRCQWDVSAWSPMGAVVITTCDVWGASGVKAAVGLSHCAQHNGCAFWSTVAAMNDDASALSRVARLQCLQRKPCNAHASRLQARSAVWGFFLCCVTDSLLYQSHSISCCAVQFDCDYLHSFF